MYIKCPHQVRQLGLFPWGKVGCSWSQILTPIIVPRLCGAIHQSPPPSCAIMVWTGILFTMLTKIFAVSLPRFHSRIKHICYPLQPISGCSMLSDIPTSWPSLLRNNTGLCYITPACTTSNWYLGITTKHRRYARYDTSIETSLQDIMVIYYELFCLTYITSINITVFSVNSTHKNLQITPLCWQGQTNSQLISSRQLVLPPH